jgi:hypothetical protein
MLTTENLHSVHLTVSCGLWVKGGMGQINLFTATDVNEMQLDHLTDCRSR